MFGRMLYVFCPLWPHGFLLSIIEEMEWIWNSNQMFHSTELARIARDFFRGFSFAFLFLGWLLQIFGWVKFTRLLEFHFDFAPFSGFLVLRALLNQLTQLTGINPVLCAECIVNRIITWNPASYSTYPDFVTKCSAKNVNATYFYMKCAQKKTTFDIPRCNRKKQQIIQYLKIF